MNVGLGPRDASYEPHFERQLAAIQPDAKGVDDFLCGAEWKICRNPDEGRQVASGSRVWAVATVVTAVRTPVILYYTLDDDCVYFIDIRRSEPADG